MSTAAEQMQARVNEVADRITREANELLAMDMHAQAIKLIAGGQKELRAIKSEATLHERAIRQEGQAARQSISNKGQTISALAGPRTRAAMSRGRAAAKRSVANEQADALAPFQRVKANIDSALTQMDMAKITIERAQRSEPSDTTPTPVASTPPPPPAQVQTTPAQWAADPSGRHELRYWDGTQWTAHVSDQGVQSQDAL